MVSTRGGARTGAESTTHSTKRIQNTTTATAKAKGKTTSTATKSKTTRAYKTAKDDVDEAVEDELVQELELPKPTRKATAKAPKKDAAKPAAAPKTGPAKPASFTKASTNATNGMNTRKVKMQSKEEEKLEEEASARGKAPELKARQQSRAARPTRATAAKEKASPLSPKKITQVSKVPARNTRNVAAKPATIKPAPAKPNTRGRPTTRKRQVSDENAGVPALEPNFNDEDEVTLQPTEKRPISPKRAASPIADEHDSPMSTRPTTPADSTQQTIDDTHESDRDDEWDAVDEEEEQNSADELCGPKTPLKRLSPRNSKKYASAQKTSLLPGIDVPVKTPVRRFAVLGTQQGTPQTQKPYCKPTIPMSDMRPMTVARAASKAMVFPRLQPFSQRVQESGRLAATCEDDESTLLSENEEDVHVDEGEGLTEEVRSINGTKDADGAEEQDPDLSLLVDPVNREMELEESIFDEATIALELTENGFDSVHEQDEGWAVKQDDETILVDDDSLQSSSFSEEQCSFTNEDSVLITRPLNHSDNNVESNVDDSMEDVPPSLTTPQPETMVWENLRPDLTIPFNLDFNISPSRNLPRAGVMDLTVNWETGTTALQEAAQHQANSDGDSSRNNTIRLSDFINVDSLSVRRQTFEAGGEVELEQPRILQPRVEDTNEEESVADGEETLLCEEPTTPPSTKRSPIKLTTAEDVDDDESAMEGDISLVLDQPIQPSVERRSPIKLTTAEDVEEDEVAIGGDMTLLLDEPSPSVTPEVPITPALVIAARVSDVTPLELHKTPVSDTPHYALSTVASRRKSISAVPDDHESCGIDAVALNTDISSTNKTPRERFPGLPARGTYEELARDHSPALSTPRAFNPVSREHERPLSTAVTSQPNQTPSPPRRATRHQTPQVQTSINDRFPTLPAKRTYEEHAKTAMPQTRFRTPERMPTKRPATAQKPTSLRKLALKAPIPRGARTPLSSLPKAPIDTPGQMPMTPHPAAPLRGVTALVDVYTSDGGCASQPFALLLKRLGAKTTKTFSDRVTHVVFKEGSPKLLQTLIIHNKQVAESGSGREVFCVNSRWVNDCEAQGKRMPETEEAYAVDVEEVPRTAKRRRKSMEPFSLLNNGGNIIRDRKSSLGRVSFARIASLNRDLPRGETETTPKVDEADKENSDAGSSPATPAYLSAPDSLVQKTAPVNRVRKLDFNAKEDAKSRRLTYADMEF